VITIWLAAGVGIACSRAGFDEMHVRGDEDGGLRGLSPTWMTDTLVAWWRMDELSGTAAIDASGNGNILTLLHANEAGTAQVGSTLTAITDPQNDGLSARESAYHGMILEITSGSLVGTRRRIDGYSGATRTFMFSALAADPTGASFMVVHQTPGKFGYAIAFDGEDDAMMAPDPTRLKSPDFVTVATWVKNASYYTRSQGLVSSYHNAGVWSYRLALNDAGEPFFEVGCWTAGFTTECTNNQTFQSILTSPGNINDGAWHHLVGTYDRRDQILYVDGVAVQRAARSEAMGASNAYGFCLGTDRADCVMASSNRDFTGSLDDVRIYHRALSAQEVAALARWAPGPLGWWKLDDRVDGNNSQVIDSSGNAANGVTSWGANSSGMSCAVDGRYGGACEFDGVDDQINIADASGRLSFAFGDFSYGSWFYANSYGPTGRGGILGRWNSSSGYNYTVTIAHGQPRLAAYMEGTDACGNVGGFANSVEGSTDVPGLLGSWHHVMVVKEQLSLAIYVDGALHAYAATADCAPYKTGVESLTLGAVTWTGAHAWDGRIDDVRIYDYARTEEQAQQDMRGE
jgi:hypothetical protein